MDRRTFNKVAGLGAFAALAKGSQLAAEQSASCMGAEELSAKPDTTAQIPTRTVEWPSQTFRRLLVDTHVPDWDDLLVDFNAAEYVATIAGAGFQSLMQYANSHVGFSLWRTKLGQMHRGMRGRDYFGEVMQECRKHGLHRVAYYSLIFDDWAYQNHPDWRILPESGYDMQLFSRTGTVCINSPYRDHALNCLQELVGNYDFEGIFLDMTFWPAICYCPHCTTRFWKEQNCEPPRLLDWTDPTWRAFQKAREDWMRDFAIQVTKTIKQTRSIPVAHQFSTAFLPWHFGVSIEQNDASDYCSGDFYGGPTQFSLVSKTFYGLTRTRPYEFMASRTIGLGDFETTKPFEKLLLESMVPTVHSAACLFIDAIKPQGTLNPHAYEFMSQINALRDKYEPFLGGNLLADVAVYYDKASMYDPDVNGVPPATEGVTKADAGPPNHGLPAPHTLPMHLPHLRAVIGAAGLLREAHLPFGVVTNASLNQLDNFRAVIVPNVLEMTPQQADKFREFVRNGGVLYASGPSSLRIVDEKAPRFLLEDVLGVRYIGRLGTSVSYLFPTDPELKGLIWPQENMGFLGSMVKAQSLLGAEVLATVTLPLVAPDVGYSIGQHFGQIWSNPPAASPGNDPGVVVNSFGKGKTIWVAAPFESQSAPVNSNLVIYLLHKALTGPYKFEADTHQAVEVTVFDQEDKRRLLVGLFNMQEQIPTIPIGATVRILVPTDSRVRRVIEVPCQREIQFKMTGPYVEFQISPFSVVAMALVEYT
ncbi:MAG: alpha-amylase family protein [Terracidiphilus sp.]